MFCVKDENLCQFIQFNKLNKIIKFVLICVKYFIPLFLAPFLLEGILT